MSVYEGIGIGFVVFAAAFAAIEWAVLIIYGIRQVEKWIKRGLAEQQAAQLGYERD